MENSIDQPQSLKIINRKLYKKEIPEELIPVVRSIASYIRDLEKENNNLRDRLSTHINLSNERIQVFTMCNGRCYYCGEKLKLFGQDGEVMHKEHVVPKSGGGGNYIDNYVPSCRSCNLSKGKKSIEEYRAHVSMKKHLKDQDVSFTKKQIEWLEENDRGLNIELVKFYGETVKNSR